MSTYTGQPQNVVVVGYGGTNSGQPQNVVIVGGELVGAPLGGGQDDGPQLQAALAAAAAAGIPFRTSGTFTLLTTVEAPLAPFIWYQGGSTFNATIAGSAVTNAAFLARATVGGTRALAADPVVGAYTFTVNSTTGLVVDGLAFVGEANNAQAFKILSITGSGPYTVHMDRAIRYPYTVAGGAVAAPITARPTGATILGERAVWNIQAHRGWELAGCERWRVEGVTIRGAGTGIASVGFAWDVVGDGNRMRDVLVDGNGLSIGRAVYIENQQDGEFDFAATRATIGAETYSSGGCTYTPRIWSVTGDGMVTDSQGTEPSVRCRIVGRSIEDAGGVGLHMSGGGIGWMIEGLRVERCAAGNIVLDTSAGNAPVNTTLSNVRSISSGGMGLSIAGGSRTSVIGGEYASNANGGIVVQPGATGALISGVQTHDNAVAGIGASESLTITGWVSVDDAVALIAASAAHVTLDGYSLSTKTRATWYGINSQSTSQVRAGTGRIRAISATAWAGTTGYLLDDQVVHGGKVYQAIQPGTSAGSGGPTGTGSAIVDGTVVWKHVATLAGVNRFGVIAEGSSLVVITSLQLEGGGTGGTDSTAVYGLFGNGGTIKYAAAWVDFGAADAPSSGTPTVTAGFTSLT